MEHDPAEAVSPAQLEAIAAARRQGRRVHRAAVTSAISGWSLVFFAATSLLSGLFSLPAFLLGLGLSVSAVIELRGSRAVRELDLAAPRRLALNQVALGIMVSAYAAWGIARALTGPGAYDEQLAGGGAVADALAPIDRLTTVVTVGVYAALIAGSVIAQGCAALYYLTRRRHMVAYLQRTPPWIIKTLRAAA